MQRVCDPNLKQQAAAINIQIDTWTKRGYIAGAWSRRGVRLKTVLLPFTGVNSFLVGKPMRFAPDMDINRATIKGVELVSGTELPSFGGIDNFANNCTGILTVVDNCGEIIGRFPLSVFNRDLNGNKLFMCNWPNVDWGACNIQVASGSGSTDNGLQFKIYLNK